MNMFILAGGKSSRFGSPKILETFDYNKKLFNKYFNTFIVTSKDLYEKIKHLDSDFIIQDMGYGSGIDVYNLFKKIKIPGFVCWSDVFYTDQNIKDIISASKFKENIMTATFKENPYVSLIIEDKILRGFKRGEKKGYQDNSLFYINDLKKPKEEFMNMAIDDFKVQITEESTRYFNTKEELYEINKTR